ncbi:hypothetical protein N9O56_02620 [Rickettsiales bacterium]|nr:hypothetical protein [Rickettsiales bacterium]
MGVFDRFTSLLRSEKATREQDNSIELQRLKSAEEKNAETEEKRAIIAPRENVAKTAEKLDQQIASLQYLYKKLLKQPEDVYNKVRDLRALWEDHQHKEGIIHNKTNETKYITELEQAIQDFLNATDSGSSYSKEKELANLLSSTAFKESSKYELELFTKRRENAKKELEGGPDSLNKEEKELKDKNIFDYIKEQKAEQPQEKRNETKTEKTSALRFITDDKKAEEKSKIEAKKLAEAMFSLADSRIMHKFTRDFLSKYLEGKNKIFGSEGLNTLGQYQEDAYVKSSLEYKLYIDQARKELHKFQKNFEAEYRQIEEAITNKLIELNKGVQKDEQMRTATGALTTQLIAAHIGLLMSGVTAISGPLMLFIIPIAALSIINAISNAIEKAEKRQEIEETARRDMRQANIEGKRNLQRNEEAQIKKLVQEIGGKLFEKEIFANLDFYKNQYSTILYNKKESLKKGLEKIREEGAENASIKKKRLILDSLYKKFDRADTEKSIKKKFSDIYLEQISKNSAKEIIKTIGFANVLQFYKEELTKDSTDIDKIKKFFSIIDPGKANELSQTLEKAKEDAGDDQDKINAANNDYKTRLIKLIKETELSEEVRSKIQAQFINDLCNQGDENNIIDLKGKINNAKEKIAKNDPDNHTMIEISLDTEADNHYNSAEYELKKYLVEKKELLKTNVTTIDRLLSGDIMASVDINPEIADLIDNLTVLTQEYQNQYSKGQIQLCDIINKDHPVHKAIQTKIAADMIMSSRDKDRGFLEQKTVAEGSVSGEKQPSFDKLTQEKEAGFEDVGVKNAPPTVPDASKSAQAATEEVESSKQQPALKVSSEISAIAPEATRNAQGDSNNPALKVSSNDLGDKTSVASKIRKLFLKIGKIQEFLLKRKNSAAKTEEEEKIGEEPTTNTPVIDKEAQVKKEASDLAETFVHSAIKDDQKIDNKAAAPGLSIHVNPGSRNGGRQS